jgi:hypothetical protein
MRPFRQILPSIALLGACVACASPGAQLPPPFELQQNMAAAVQSEPQLTGADIIAQAHASAGGSLFIKPGSLKLSGYNIIHAPDGDIVWERYTMWRVFSEEKPDAHTAEGKVRIEAYTGDKLAMLLAYDGVNTYNQDGRMDDQSANATWGANFGYGAIRNALDEGWTQQRVVDRLIDGQPTFMIALTDPSGGKTLFGIRCLDRAIVYVGFDTPRGWHERRYSHFFSKPGSAWVQAGRVRLFYNGVKANEAIWTDFEIGEAYDDTLFVIN